MEGSKKKRKVGGIILLCMSFLLVIVLTFTLTLAWFFDSDWSSNYVTMAGSVGIEIRDESDPDNIVKASGAGNLHFNISTDLAYPGQAIDASASVYNNGGISANEDPVTNPGKGSACYIRARFIVYTNIGTSLEGVEDDNESDYVNATILYQFLNGLVTAQNNLPIEEAPYYWQYFTREGGCGLSTSGTSDGDILYYLEGASATTKQTGKDEGYFYLCQKSGYDATNKVGSTNGYMYPLAVGNSSVFLWNDQFIIPWQLTNYSADKHIFVAVEFQAIQTFIPKIENGGIINSDPDNQEYDNDRSAHTEDNPVPYYVLYNNESIQTVFNSINFRVGDNAFSTVINVNGVDIDFGDYASVSRPS